jgi:hypothetical protein
MIYTLGCHKLHIFDKVIDIYPNMRRSDYQKQLNDVKAIGYKPGDIIEIEDYYYAVDDDLYLEPIDGEDDGDFEISFNVTKNIMDFRTTFKDILKSWDAGTTIHSIEIRPDDTFIVEQFGISLYSDVSVTYLNNDDNYIVISKKLRTISAKKGDRLNDIWISIRFDIEYDVPDHCTYYLENIRLKEKTYDNLSPYDYLLKLFNPTDYNYIAEAEKNGYDQTNWFNNKYRYFLKSPY